MAKQNSLLVFRVGCDGFRRDFCRWSSGRRNKPLSKRIQRKCAANILSLARRRKKAGRKSSPSCSAMASHSRRAKSFQQHSSGHCQQPQYVPTPFSMCWSYLLSNSKRVINTHSETTAGRALFRDGMRQRRCLIPASNYVEWERNDSGKVKYAIRSRQSGLMYMASILPHRRRAGASSPS